MEALSERQLKLLDCIIKEYLSSSEPVASQTISKKYVMKVSAATIRNEMADLLKKGFLEMPHTSSGRVPTSIAYRLFLDEMMEENEIPVLQEVAIKQRLWPNRFEFDRLLRQAAVSLSDITKELAIATTSEGHVAHAGAVNILDHVEFWDIDVAKAALHLLDRFELLEEVFKRAPAGGEVRVIIGSEMERDDLSSCSVVFAPYSVGNKSGHIAVLGPTRVNYANVIPAVRYTKKLVEELAESW